MGKHGRKHDRRKHRRLLTLWIWAPVVVSIIASAYSWMIFAPQASREPFPVKGFSARVDLTELSEASATFARVAEPAAPAQLKFDGRRAFDRVKKVVESGPRVAGSLEEGLAADYLELTLRELGYSVDRQDFRAPNGRAASNIIADSGGEPIRNPRRRWLAIGAHYDTVAGTVGANDNASGVATVVELAETLRSSDLPFDIIYLLFSSEEDQNPARDSYAGSETYIARIDADAKERLIGYINIDMVGWPGAGHSVGNLKLADQHLYNLSVELAEQRGVSIVKNTGYSVRKSDHQSFERAGIPTVSFGAADYPYHHKPQDDLSKISAASLEIIGGLITAIVRGIDR